MNAARTYLREIIGLGIDPAGLARANAVLEEGLDALTELADFDAAEIKTLCQAVRKPGGTIIDPNNATRVIQNPGHNIPSICEGRLILACYGDSLYQYIGT